MVFDFAGPVTQRRLLHCRRAIAGAHRCFHHGIQRDAEAPALGGNPIEYGNIRVIESGGQTFGFRHVYGWKDKDANGEDEGYSRLPLDQLVETLAVQAKALGLHIDLSYKFHDPGRFGGSAPKLIEGMVKGSEEKKR